MGSTFRLPVVNVADPHDAIRQLRAPGLVVVAAVARDGVPMQEVDFARPIALLVGSEGTGLTADHVRAADVRVTIPMAPPVESLNVAVAAGVLAYEARRQRNQ
jgi:TrmH family RNA methyltransferase